MKRSLIPLIGILLLLIGCTTQTENHTAQETKKNLYTSQITGDTSLGNVAIEARPLSVDPLVIELSFNTHSYDLSQINLSEQVELIVSNFSYAPDGAADITGHHATIPLTFDVSAPKRFTLIIHDVGLEKERRYVWEEQ